MQCLCCKGQRKAEVTLGQDNLETSQQDDDFNDSRLPLTRKQKFVLTKNWKGIEREVSSAGVEMFLKSLFGSFYCCNVIKQTQSSSI